MRTSRLTPTPYYSTMLTYNDTHSLHWRILCESAEKRAIIFYYEGYFSQSIIAAVADAVKMRITHMGADSSKRRKLFSSFIEMAQNIIHYSTDAYVQDDSADFCQEVRHGSVCISTQDGRYYLHCANPMDTERARRLREKLEHLRTLTIDDIRREYKQTLRAETPYASKGAGLGLLTVARDASEPLDFEFLPLEGCDQTLFYLKATI